MNGWMRVLALMALWLLVAGSVFGTLCGGLLAAMGAASAGLPILLISAVILWGSWVLLRKLRAPRDDAADQRRVQSGDTVWQPTEVAAPDTQILHDKPDQHEA